MIYMLDTNQDYDKCADELGVYPDFVGQLITPLTRRRNRMRKDFGIDNGAFSKFDEQKFLNELRKQTPYRESCRFVASPDVVCDAPATLRNFHAWKARLSDWPISFVLQDGVQSRDVPWYEIASIFIGGSDRFKDSKVVEECIGIAKELGHWIHVGRVNGCWRMERFEHLKSDSVDGTGIARYTKSRKDLAKHRGDTFLF